MKNVIPRRRFGAIAGGTLAAFVFGEACGKEARRTFS
jgi:hypothetical protein